MFFLYLFIISGYSIFNVVSLELQNLPQYNGGIQVIVVNSGLNPNNISLKVPTNNDNFLSIIINNPKLDEDQNDNDDNSYRIVGGYLTQISDHPYMVNYGNICGGTILSKYWIITAAHCGENKDTIQVGSTRKRGGDVYKIKKHVTHYLFGSSEQRMLDYDFQLLELERPLTMSPYVQPAEIEEDHLSAGTMVTATGWGLKKENGKSSNALMSVDIPIISTNKCSTILRKHGLILTDRMMCAGYASGKKDACQGDSGGPLTHENRLVGVVSFGIGCARPYMPGVYSKVSSVRDWINMHTGV